MRNTGVAGYSIVTNLLRRMHPDSPLSCLSLEVRAWKCCLTHAHQNWITVHSVAILRADAYWMIIMMLHPDHLQHRTVLHNLQLTTYNLQLRHELSGKQYITLVTGRLSGQYQLYWVHPTYFRSCQLPSISELNLIILLIQSMTSPFSGIFFIFYLSVLYLICLLFSSLIHSIVNLFVLFIWFSPFHIQVSFKLFTAYLWSVPTRISCDFPTTLNSIYWFIRPIFPFLTWWNSHKFSVVPL